MFSFGSGVAVGAGVAVARGVGIDVAVNHNLPRHFDLNSNLPLHHNSLHDHLRLTRTSHHHQTSPNPRQPQRPHRHRHHAKYPASPQAVNLQLNTPLTPSDQSRHRKFIPLARSTVPNSQMRQRHNSQTIPIHHPSFKSGFRQSANRGQRDNIHHSPSFKSQKSQFKNNLTSVQRLLYNCNQGVKRAPRTRRIAASRRAVHNLLRRSKHN